MKKLYLFALFLVLYEFTTYISNDMIMPGMIMIVNEFHTSFRIISFSLALYILGSCSLQLLIGPLAEYYGEKRVILVGVISFIIFSLWLAFTKDTTSFLLARLLQGSGMAFVALGYSLIHRSFNDSQAVRLIAIMGNITVLAPLLGPVFGGLIIQTTGSWRYVFIITVILAMLAFIGLQRYTQNANVARSAERKFHWQNISKQYKMIFCHKQFLFGAVASALAVLPLLTWIALMPTIIMHTNHLSMNYYVFYQSVAIAGLLLGTIVMQFIAGKISFYTLICTSSLLSFIGIVLSFIFYNHILLLSCGFFLYSFGLVIFNNLVVRLIMRIPNLASNLIASLMVFVQNIVFVIGIEIADKICDIFNYSVLSFEAVQLGIGFLFFILINVYALQNRDKQWN